MKVSGANLPKEKNAASRLRRCGPNRNAGKRKGSGLMTAKDAEVLNDRVESISAGFSRLSHSIAGQEHRPKLSNSRKPVVSGVLNELPTTESALIDLLPIATEAMLP